MISKATFTLEDGTLVSIKGTKGIITTNEDCEIFVKDGEELTVTVGNDRLFALEGNVVINRTGSYLKIK